MALGVVAEFHFDHLPRRRLPELAAVTTAGLHPVPTTLNVRSASVRKWVPDLRISAWASLTVAALLAGCTLAPTPTPTSSPSAPPAAGSPIVIGLAIPEFAESQLLYISNATSLRVRQREIIPQLVYNALYRYDESLTPVPDLAAEPCEVRADHVTIRCTLREATFHDGSSVTADDVAFTFEVGRRHPECPFAYGECFGEMLSSATAVDERTVEFRLSAPNATFMTLILPGVMIESRAVVEAAYAVLAERAPTLDATEYSGAADGIDAQLQSAEPDCASPLAGAEALLQAASIEPLPRDEFNQADGSFDVCMYAESTAILLRDLAASLEASGLDAIALAYRALSFNRAPIGTGPWRFAGVTGGDRASFEAFEGYHRGAPATPRIEVRVIRGDPAGLREQLLNGELDWTPIPPVLLEMYTELPNNSDSQVAIFPQFTYFMLAFNLREGMLFADPALRKALELCVDKPQTVDAATDGAGDVIYSPIEPASWAYQPDLPRPERDVDEARRLIETAGWSAGADGVYERDGRRLATDVFVTAEEAQRVAFMDLVAEQARDCGIELTVVPADRDSVLRPLDTFPHIAGGYDKPFEALFVGWNHGLDPHDVLWHSSSVTSAEQPRNLNFMGFADEHVDELIDQGVATYDQRERARIYRELQQVLADERPVLFAWAPRQYEALDARLGLTDGQINLSSRMWFWELEKLILRAGQGS